MFGMTAKDGDMLGTGIKSCKKLKRVMILLILKKLRVVNK